ncbi:glycosyltransferase [Marinobacter sp. 1Y8]
MNKAGIKLLFFIDGIHNPCAGTEGQFIKLVNGLCEFGVEVEVVSLASSDYLKSKPFNCGVNILGCTKILSLVTVFKVISAAIFYRLKGFGIVHFFFNDSALLGPILFKMLGFKTVTSRRDMGIWYTSNYIKILKLNRFFTDRYVSNSRAVKELTRKAELVSSKNISVVYNGYQEVKPSVNGHEFYFPFSAENFVFGMVANLRPVKRIGDAIRALSIILPRYPHACLVFVGAHDPRDPANFHDDVKEMGLEKHIFFAGRQENIYGWISKFDACVLCSESEGFSNSIIEYMQQGKPVICSDVGGNAEIIEQGVNGLLYEKGNVEDLAHCMEALVASPNLANSFGCEAEVSVRARFSIDNMIQNYLETYDGL